MINKEIIKNSKLINTHAFEITIIVGEWIQSTIFNQILGKGNWILKGEMRTNFIFHFHFWGHIDEKDFDKYTKSHEEEGPRLVLFLKGTEQLEMAVIVTDSCKIYCQAKSILDSIIIVLASYYVFNLDYPRKYNQCLGFSQQCVLEDAFTGDKSSKYKHFLQKIMNDILEWTC